MDKKYHHGDLKIQLIKSGLQMIQEDGINKLSLRRLAQMCNVSEAAPYSHFKNKEELLIAIQEYVTEQLLKCLQDAYEKTEHCNSPIAILNMGKAYVQFFIKYPEYYSFIRLDNNKIIPNILIHRIIDLKDYKEIYDWPKKFKKGF